MVSCLAFYGKLPCKMPSFACLKLVVHSVAGLLFCAQRPCIAGFLWPVFCTPGASLAIILDIQSCMFAHVFSRFSGQVEINFRIASSRELVEHQNVSKIRKCGFMLSGARA